MSEFLRWWKLCVIVGNREKSWEIIHCDITAPEREWEKYRQLKKN